MGERAFLARLTQTSAQPLVEEVAHNLYNVLNTRKGYGSVIAEFGLGDYEQASKTSDAVLMLIEELAEVVRLYEPRVSEVEVSMLGRVGYDQLRFELRCSLCASTERFWLDINTGTRAVAVVIIRRLGD